MTLDEAIDKMMTCATAHVCPREEACFEVVKWALEQRTEQVRREGILKVLDRVEEQDVVEHYAPHFPPQTAWEWAREMDWDAA